MADLITHAAVAWLLRLRSRDRVAVELFVVGAVLPDVVSRVPSIALTSLRDQGLPVPPALLVGWEPLHMPVGMVVLSALLAVLFAPEGRGRAFRNLLGGMGLHLLVDLLQDHMGVGYLLGFPLRLPSVELGLIGPEATVLVVPVLAVAVALGARWRRRRDVVDD